MGMEIRQLAEEDHAAATALLGADPVGGGLIHGLILRYGLLRGPEFWGMFDDLALVGIMALDKRGRCPVYGGGAGWSPFVAGLASTWLRTGRQLSSIDLPYPMAETVTAQLAPVSISRLAIWHCPSLSTSAGETAMPPYNAPSIEWRPATPGDAQELQALYQAEAGFAWVDVADSLRMCADGQRIWLTGRVGEVIVTSGWANTLEPGAGRISGVLTAPAQRGKGFATELVSRLACALLRQARVPYLYVADDATAAQEVYSRLGFVPHSRRQTLIFEGVDRR